LRIARGILNEYIRYVNVEPLIGHIDRNPFGVKCNPRQVLAPSLNLKQMSQSLIAQARGRAAEKDRDGVLYGICTSVRSRTSSKRWAAGWKCTRCSPMGEVELTLAEPEQ
jgi:hypothetical protein